MILLMVLVLTSACTQEDEEDKGPLSIRHDLDIYDVDTTPYEGKIVFDLSSEEILSEIEEPIEITTVYQTTLYLAETVERDDSMVVLTVGFDYNYQSPSGEMLSLYHLYEEGRFTSSGVEIKVFDEDGKELDVARGSGDGEKYGYEQWVGVQIPKELLTDNEDFTFEIDGLYVLDYRER